MYDKIKQKEDINIKYDWTQKEVTLLKKYLNSKLSELTLFKEILKVNPKRTYISILRKIARLKEAGIEKNSHLKKLRIGYLDIEATSLTANFGHILSWFIKYKGQNKFECAVITKDEIFNEQFDRRLIIELLTAFENFDVLYTHYGSDRRFDIPFIRTRAYRHGLEKMLPRYMEKFIMDTWLIARNKLRLHSNRLDSIADALNIKGIKKTPLLPEVWELAKVGNVKALEYIVKHNKRDVQLLERIHTKLEVIERPKYISI